MNKKNFIWNVIGSVVNSFTSLFYMIIVTRINGINDAGIFSFAFAFVCFAQVIANYAGRSYQVTNNDKSITYSDFIYSRFLTCFFMFVFCLIFIFFKNYDIYKNIIIIILCSLKLIESIGDAYYGILQSEDKLYKVGISLFVKGITSVLLFFTIDLITKNMIFACISTLLINIIITLLYDIKQSHKCNFKLQQINKINIKKILIGGFFVFIFTFLIQYLLNASKYAIDSFLSDNYQTIFGIIIMPATLMALCSQFLVQPFLTTITKLLKQKEIKSLIGLTIKICFILFALGCLALLICYLIGIPILQLIYGIELNKYKYSLLIIIAGSTFYGITYILSTILIAMRKNLIQAIILAIISVTTYFLSNYLVQTNGVFGASLSYIITMVILLFSYIICITYFFKKLKKESD